MDNCVLSHNLSKMVNHRLINFEHSLNINNIYMCSTIMCPGGGGGGDQGGYTFFDAAFRG